MSKALYILEYQLNVISYGKFEKANGVISVTAESYQEACENAVKRLPDEIGEKTEYEHSGYGYGSSKPTKKEYRHKFRLKDCLDENHALFVPSQQNINVDNSTTSHNSATAIAYRGGIFG